MNLPLVVLLGLQASAPLPPVLSVGTPSGRFEFAPVPEIAFVAGIAERVELGPFYLDPANRWQYGDFTRASGWQASRATRLVEAASGAAPPGVTYDATTATLAYSGAWSGQATVRLETADGTITSAPFRIRALAPTVVYGESAAAAAAAHGWSTARLCEAPAVSFSTCRQSSFSGGGSDGAPLVIYITPGRYAGQDWFIGSKRFAYVLGDPIERPTLEGDTLANSNFERWHIANLVQDGSRITQAAARSDVPSFLTVYNVRQCCETRDQNGIVNPHGTTFAPWTIALWQFESVGMGSPGNAQHGVYLEGRPDSTLEVNNCRFFGSRGSSSIKTTMQRVAVRNTRFCVAQVCGRTDGWLTHTPIDLPATVDFILYNNELEVFRRSTVGQPSGTSGVLEGTVFLRARQAMYSSDIPAYPNKSWLPPRSSYYGGSPGGGFPRGPETYVADAFWSAVRATPVTDPANAYGFKHDIGFNRFVQLPGSLSVLFLRDDGTYPKSVVYQFGPSRAERTHPQFAERSVSRLYGNTLDGLLPGQRPYRLDDSAYVAEIAEEAKCTDPPSAACWPRWAPEHYPQLIEVTGELPPWFRL